MPRYEELRDRRGALLARIASTRYRSEIRDSRSQLLGTCDPRTNETRDRLGVLVGKGNLLKTLIRL